MFHDLTLVIICALYFSMTFASSLNESRSNTSSERTIYNITYLYVEQYPYESIIDETWRFHFGRENKSLQGIISRAVNLISNTHCPHFNFQPRKVENFKTLNDYLVSPDIKSLNDDGYEGEYFMLAPVPVSVRLYYNMHYKPRLFSWLSGFADTPGVVVVRRLDDVYLLESLLMALKESTLFLYFLFGILPSVAVLMWIVDRKWKIDEHVRSWRGMFSKMYWAVVTMATVGYGDIVPVTAIGKILSVLWMLVSLIVVACFTSVITTRMVEPAVNLLNKEIAVVKGTWDETIGRLLVNHYRSSNYTLTVDTYEELLDKVRDNTTLFAGFLDYNVAATMQKEMTEKHLGE